MKTPILILFTLLLCFPAAAQLNQMTLVGQYVGENQDDQFGAATAIGDFDNDGQDEYMIAASEWGDYEGKNYFYDWDGDWPIEPAWTFQGTQQFYMYGVVDQNIGDINGDGIDDLGLVEIAYNEYGRFDVLFGGTEFDSLADWSFEEPNIGFFSSRLDSLGDMNGDGFNDFVIEVTSQGFWYDEIRIYYGGAALDTIYDWRYFDGWVNDIPDPLGDINGDGFNDIMIFNYEASPMIFLGGSPMDTIPDLIFNGYTYNTSAAIGDVNADGYDDFALRMLPESTYLGRAVYFGSAEIDTIPDLYLQDEYGEPAGAPYLVTHGDVNGDGIDDLITGDAAGAINVAYVYLGSPWFNPVPDAMILGVDSQYNWGYEMSVGDVNGDGRDEILISSSTYWFQQGLAQLYEGPEDWIDYGAAVEPSDLVYSPGRYKLYQNYPNPFNASTTIRFELGTLSFVTLRPSHPHHHRWSRSQTGRIQCFLECEILPFRSLFPFLPSGRLPGIQEDGGGEVNQLLGMTRD